MRIHALSPILLVALVACSDMRHPSELVGTWARDSVYGNGLVRGTDTLRLGKDGIALRSGSIAATDHTSSTVKPTVYAEGLKWDFRPRAEGHLLCFFVERGSEPNCNVVRIASDSVILVDDRAYHRLAGR